MENYTLKTIEELANNIFIVEKYQRGYKWGIREVEDLLLDINSFETTKQDFYCLQPIVVKQLENTYYELIDGQQRLTTTFIILQCLDTYLFDIQYNTREKSAEFLNSIKKLVSIDLGTAKRNEINTAWENYISENPENNNVDNYHFFTSYQIIANWLKPLNDEAKQVFKEKLCKHTKVIWYEIISQQTPEEIFINFNQGKIHLEQAELIKALFVLYLKEETNSEIRAFKTNQFAEEWNTIENQLQDDKFWFFVSNDTSDKRKANRIDLLFDIVCKKEKKHQSNLFSYHKYLEKLNEKKLTSDDWQEIKSLFNLLFEWYHDRTIYHLMGLIIYLEVKTISEIFGLYKKEHDKIVFEKKLKKELSDKIKFDDPESKYNLSNLSYKGGSETLTVLILFNVATYQTSDFNYRFPFDKLKTQNWSIEHIHAQKSEEFKFILETKEWIKDFLFLIKELKKEEEKKEIKDKLFILFETIKPLKEDSEIPREIKNLTKEINDLLDKKLDPHNIKNLCLLDGPTNSSLSNSNFRDKREEILKIDMLGEVEVTAHKKVKTFIPVCTKNVFLKYYSQNSQEIQFSYWGHKDRNDYEVALEKVISKYLN